MERYNPAAANVRRAQQHIITKEMMREAMRLHEMEERKRQRNPATSRMSESIRRDFSGGRQLQNNSYTEKQREIAASQKFSRHLKESFMGVPPSNILNFDEVHLTDEVHTKPDDKCIFRRGTKQAGASDNDFMISISVMLSGTAIGEMLPPYVLYKCKSNPGRITDAFFFS